MYTSTIHTNKPWFDESCFNAKRSFKLYRNIYNRDKNIENRSNFVSTRTRYNKIKKKSKHAFKVKEGLRINSLASSQPRKFWKNIKKSYRKETNSADLLTLDELFNHFKDMFGSTATNDDDLAFEGNLDLNNEELENEIQKLKFTKLFFRKIVIRVRVSITYRLKFSSLLLIYYRHF